MNAQVKEIILKAYDIIDNLISEEKYSKYCQLYSFTTENIKDYYTNIDFENKKVLTICASGDHIFNAIFLGAKKVTSFDINILSKYYFELKKACIQYLSYREFINYFMIGAKEINDEVFAYEIYLKISKHLDKDTKEFWDNIYKKYNFDGYYIRHSNLFNNKYDDTNLKISSNIYLTKENFLILKEALPFTEIDFINCSITELSDNINSTYDIIALSNISDYITNIYKNDIITNFYKKIIKKLVKKLNEKGIIIYGYIYDFDQNKTSFRSDIDNFNLVKSIITETKIWTFKSVINGKKDATLYIEED